MLLRYREREAWRKTPYQITTLFKYHKEYNPHIFRQEQAGTPAATENMDDIDIALGGLLIMADKTQNVKTRLSFDGEAEYKAACKEINSTLKVLNSEMKLVTAEYKDNASSVDALKAKQAVLQKTYDEQAKKVKETEAALEKCRKATGDNSEESKKT